jgi:Fe/S biogenesis protein NfuA
VKVNNHQMTETIQTDKVLEVSEAAVSKIRELIETRGRPGLAVRVAIRGTLPGGGYQTEFKFQDRSEAKAEDVVQPAVGFDFIFETGVADKVRGSRVDFDEKRYTAGFNIEYPHKSPFPPELSEPKHWDNPVARKVQDVMDNYINPGVAGHGGWVLLKDVKNDAAIVEMGGGCQGCGMAAVTLRQGIETAILQAVPEIKKIVDITEHEAGEDPYYSQQAAEAMGASPFAK